MAQDAVGTILDDGTVGDVVFTYDDTTPKISATVKDDSHSHTGATLSAINLASDLNTFSSADLAGKLTDETGSGLAVFATSPTLTTPTLGVATATSIDFGTTTLLASRSLTVDTGGVFNIAIGSAAGDDFTVGTSKLVVEGDTGNVGIGTATPSQKLDLIGNFELENTTSDSTGVIYKGASRFIHNFEHPTGDTATPVGYNLFIGEGAGNFTMGSTATQTYHASYNIGIGRNTLIANTIGYSNLAIGDEVLLNNTEGRYNVGIGENVLLSNTSGYHNVAIGSGALQSNTSGYYNTALGGSAGRFIAGGSTANATSNKSFYLGTNTKALADGDTNEIVIGYGATGAGSNSVVLGDDAITKTILKGKVGIGETSPDYKLDVNGSLGFTPGTSVTPVDNGDVVIEATNNTTLTFKLKGSDGTVRSGTITLT